MCPYNPQKILNKRIMHITTSNVDLWKMLIVNMLTVNLFQRRCKMIWFGLVVWYRYKISFTDIRKWTPGLSSFNKYAKMKSAYQSSEYISDACDHSRIVWTQQDTD